MTKDDECKPLEQIINDKLQGWKSKSLSMMGKVTLIKFVLSAMPVYLMANTIILKGTILKLEQRSRKFLWGTTIDVKRMHFLS